MSADSIERNGPGFRLTKRDADLLKSLSTYRLLTVRQIGALFFVKSPGWEWDAGACKSAAAKRISALQRREYLRSSYVPGTAGGEKCYFLGPEGVRFLRSDVSMEDLRPPRHGERQRTGASFMAVHDRAMNNFLINMQLLAKLRDDLVIDETLGTEDLQFFVKTVQHARKPYKFKPDSYIRGGTEGSWRALFFEMDTGGVAASRIQSKVVLYFHFVHQRLYEDSLGIDVVPAMCFIAPDKERMNFLARQIREAMREKEWARGHFYLATGAELGSTCVEEGYVTENPLKDEYWFDHKGRHKHSPFTHFKGAR
ncbi:MAG: replication-relaxation family protein [Actinobacteria bacterium]|nr:replication-relaxation family protein [Actinomycetota bacterium]